MAFTHLHVHSEYSLLDGMGKIKEYVDKCKKLGMDSLALTDHGVMYGAVDIYNICKASGIRPIIGCEVYVAPGSRFEKKKGENDEKYYHLILLVKNDTGYHNLCHLVSKSNIEGFYYKPRIDFELLKQYHEGLVCLSACVAGEVPQLILRGEIENAERTVLKYRELFGEDYYLEIQNHGLNDEIIAAQELVRIARKYDIKLVCTNDCHYVNSEDIEAHEWLLCMQTKKTIYDEDRMKYEGDYSLKSEEEMRALFPALPDAFDNTVEIAGKCNFDFEFGNYRMPKVVIPKEYGTDYFKYLADEAWKGYEERYPVGHESREQAREKLTYELEIIKQMNFAEYFLDTRKTIMWAKNNDILVGPGRGSAAGSVMCYSLKITDIDPIKYNLLFERFLNPERISMPDIDVDYQFDKKEDVIAFEADSNGKDSFAKIQTFFTMQAKDVVKSCARVAAYPVEIGNKLSKMIPNDLGTTLKKAVEANPELLEYIDSDPKIKHLWNIALRLEGLKKAVSTHACGHIPTPVPCEDLFPVSVDSETGYLICQYNMVEAEHLGNLKKDLLMLRNLTIISMAHKEIKRRHGIDVPLWTDEILNDKEALALFAAGDTNGVFQFESAGMKNFMKELKPDSFEDIIAGVSLYRPGPMDFIPAYIRGKKDPGSVTYITPELEHILEPTYGCIVYQEQVMQIVRDLAGFSRGRSDLVRKAMGKKNMEVMQTERVNFVYGNEELGINGCVKNNISEEIGNTIYDDMIDFAKYAFNKSHAACYAAVAMQTAYLKAHYPQEFYAGLLTSVMDTTTKLAVYLSECKRKGITVLPPDINTSSDDFTVTDDGKIRFGISAIKKAGKVVKSVIDARKEGGRFFGLTDFVQRVVDANKGVIESFVKAGMFDFTGYSRNAMLHAVEMVIKSTRKDMKSQVDGQLSFADLFADNSIEKTEMKQDSFVDMPELPRQELLLMEKEVSGIYISGHPLNEVDGFMAKHVTKYASDFKTATDETEEERTEGMGEDKDVIYVMDGENVKVGGLITSVKQIFTKAGNKAMAFVTIEDYIGTIEVVVFPKQYEKYRNVLEKDHIIIVEGAASVEDEKSSVLADRITDLADVPRNLWIQFSTMEDYNGCQEELIKMLRDCEEGKDNVLIYIRETKQKSVRNIKVNASADTLTALKVRFGNDNVAVAY